MPELAGQPVGTVEQPAAADDPAADPGRDGQVDEVVAVAAGADVDSPSAATFVSRSRNVGSPRAASTSRASGMSWKSGPRFGGSTTVPMNGSTGPGEEIPIPASWSATVVGAPTVPTAAPRCRQRRQPARPRTASGWQCGQVASRPAGSRRPGCGSRPGRAQGPVVGTGLTPGFVSGKADPFYQSRDGIPGLRAGRRAVTDRSPSRCGAVRPAGIGPESTGPPPSAGVLKASRREGRVSRRS